jgi:hypothetical protein
VKWIKMENKDDDDDDVCILTWHGRFCVAFKQLTVGK